MIRFAIHAAFQDAAQKSVLCVQSYEKANHHTVAHVNNDSSDRIIKVVKNYGEKVDLDDAGSYDPDGDELEYSWWVYAEAGRNPYDKPMEIRNGAKQQASLMIPEPGKSM